MNSGRLETGIKDHAVPRFYVPVVLKFLGGSLGDKKVKKGSVEGSIMGGNR